MSFISPLNKNHGTSFPTQKTEAKPVLSKNAKDSITPAAPANKDSCCNRFLTWIKDLISKIFCCFCVRKKEDSKTETNTAVSPKEESASQTTKATKTEKTMDKSSPSKIEQPKIVSDSWGKITVGLNGQSQSFKDVIIVPGKAIAWDWNWNAKVGPMSHKPGIREIDLDHFILSQDPKPDVVILSKGRGHNPDNSLPGELNVDPKLEDYLKKNGIKEVFILKTAESIKKYEEICKNAGIRVAALIHTTC